VPLPELGGPGGCPDVSLLGVRLPMQGAGVGERVVVDWAASPWMLLAGMPGSGKTVTLNCLLAQQICAGARVAVVDERSKAVDFAWAKEFVMPGGWGCDSEAHAVATLAMVYREGQRRAQRLSDLGHVSWVDMPPGERFEPVFVVVDEAAALLVADPVPKGLPKDHPLVAEVTSLNFHRALIGRYINRIVAEQRFVGVRMVISNQVTNQATGLPPSLRSKIGHRILQGTNPSRSARAQTFNDEQSVPTVPQHVKASGDRARGVGLCDLEGQAPAVYKAMFADPADYRRRLLELGVRTTDRPAPTAAQVAAFSMLADPFEPESTTGTPVSFGAAGWETGEDGQPLSGLARANAARHALGRRTRASGGQLEPFGARAGEVVASQGSRCGSCGGWVHPQTGVCGCS
ncbi:MAG: hypothetical protein WCG47_25700, partial [Dermatophilaceae bacterium]